MAIIFGSDAGIKQNSLKGYFAKTIDDLKQSAAKIENMFSLAATLPPKLPKEKVYVDGGYENVPGTSFLGSNISNIDDIKQRSTITQEPMLTVYIKKRAFWSLRNENMFKYLDRGEKIFLRATKLLFEKKCSQIAAYEAMTKANRLISDESELDFDRASQAASHLENSAQQIIALLSDAIEKDPTKISMGSLMGAFSAQDAIKNIAFGLKELKRRARVLNHATQTSWIVHPDTPDLYQSGRGAGVIELTLLGSLNTSLSLDGSGSINFSIEDPYNLTKITNDDVEIALHAAVSEMDALDNSTTGFNSALKGPQYYLEQAKNKEVTLQKLRKTRKDRAAGFGTDAFVTNSGNQVVGTTEAQEIIFEINPTSSSSANRVMATMPSWTQSYPNSDFQLQLATLPLEQQLSSAEVILVKEIFSLLERYVAELERINESYRAINKTNDVKHARANLRKHYLGKSIIQPMDGVNVYIRGKTINTDSVSGPLSMLLNNTPIVKKFANDSQVSDFMLREEMRALGIEQFNIPVDFYRSIRTSSFLKNGGNHVFGGLIKGVTEKYDANSGKYTTSVVGTSNMRWLEISRINEKPSLDQTQGLLEDPMTPFDIEVDPGTGLIKETPELNETNKKRLQAGLLWHNSGENYGKKLDADENTGNFNNDFIPSGGGAIQKQYRHLPGLVYKWKQGIIVATRNVNLKTSLYGTENQYEKLRRDTGLIVVQNPFSGQDAADIVSLLVTGYPHNYETFYENAKSIGTFSDQGDNSGRSYFNSLFDIVRSQNKSLGNFQPAKLVNKDPRAIHDQLNKRTAIKSVSRELANLRSQLAELQDQRAQLSITDMQGETGDEDRNRTKKSIDSIISELKKEIREKEGDFYKTVSYAEDVGLRLYGNDIAFDIGKNESEAEDVKENVAKIRLRNTLVKFRPQYDCKFNQDSNLFMIGDEYDKDLDVRAFAIGAISQENDIWNSDYKKPYDVCRSVADAIDFEFFCDTNGHIQFRPPRYNKVPLSLLLKMFMLDKRENKTLYTGSLNLQSLFKTRQKAFEDDIEVIDLSVKEELILLGAQNYNENASNIVVDGDFISSLEPVPSSVPLDMDMILGLTANLIQTRNELRGKVGGTKINSNDSAEVDSVEKEILELNDPSRPSMYAKRLYHINKLSQILSRREKMSETLEKIRSHAKEHDFLGGLDINSSTGIEALAPYQDLIEDDFNDYLGAGSSKRYIIKDEQIISYDFTESDAQVKTHVVVNGQIDLVGDKAGSIGGVPVLQASAADFDLWRQYGYRPDTPKTRPFIKDVELQGAPYAVMLLNRYKKNTVVGNITLYGNEYYQLGDVVYITSRDMLFYVNGITQSFSYENQSYTTTLDLRYGHPLGEYIPTPFDVIGKALIKNQRKFNQITVSRETASESLGVHLAAIKFHSKQSSNELQAMLSGDFGYYNERELKNALVIAYSHIGENKDGAYPKIEIRGFSTTKQGESKVSSRISAVSKWFKAPVGKYIAEDKRHLPISEYYWNRSLGNKQVVETKPVIVTSDKKAFSKSDALRLPREEVYNIGNGSPDNVIEVVLIFEEVTDEE